MKTQKLSPTPALYRPAIPILATGFGQKLIPVNTRVASSTEERKPR